MCPERQQRREEGEGPKPLPAPHLLPGRLCCRRTNHTHFSGDNEDATSWWGSCWPDPGTRRSKLLVTQKETKAMMTPAGWTLVFHVLPTMTLIIPFIPDSTPRESLDCYLFWTLGSPNSSEISSLCWITRSL